MRVVLWLAACGVTVAVATAGSFLFIKNSGAESGMLDDQAAWMVASNRYMIASEQFTFWIGIGKKDATDPLKAETDRLARLADDIDAKVKAKWKGRLKTIRQLSGPAAGAAQRMLDETKRGGKRSLLNALDSLDVESARVKAKIEADHPIVLEPRPQFDLKTLAGERAFEEWMILHPGRDKLAIATRNAIVARKYADSLAAVTKARIEATKGEIAGILDRVEADFLKSIK